MSYSLNIYGHGNAQTAEAAKKVFADAIRELRKATPEGGSVGGSLGGSEDGKSFSLNATDVDKEEVAPNG